MVNANDNISHANKLDFQKFSDMVTSHPACNHNLFSNVTKMAAADKLSGEQMDLFTKAMMARIFRTIPNIAEVIQSSLLSGDNATAKTAMQNLVEEMGGGGKTHQQLGEEAFNALRAAYSLPPVTMKHAHDEIPLPESYSQEQVWVNCYKNFPVIASWIQETASGGNSRNSMGMMADMFKIFTACQKKIGIEKFHNNVIPYFAAHINIEEKNGKFYPSFNYNGVEYQHGFRAASDAMREFTKLPPEKRGIIKKTGEAFLNAQSSLFDAIQLGMFPDCINKKQQSYSVKI